MTMASRLHVPRRASSADEKAPPSRSRRDAMAWLALGLVVALVLAWTALPSTKARDAARPATVSSTSPRDSARNRENGPRDATRASAHHRTRNVDATSTSIPSQRLETGAVPSTTVPATTTTLARRAPASTESSAPITYRGMLRFPNDVATTYFPSANGGAFVAAGSWTAGRSLELTLTCGSAVDTSAGTGGAVAKLAVATGACQLLVAEPPGATWNASYTITVRVQPVARRAPGATPS
jgi:hypothetical protein